MALQKSRVCLAVIGALAVGLSQLAPSMWAHAQASKLKTAGIEEDALPAAILRSALAGNRGMPAIDRYLRGDGAPPGVVTRRATALIRAIGKIRNTMRPQDLLAAVDSITHVAARSLSYATVMRLAMEPDYRPENATLAWDFGPGDGTVMPGFERVVPGDRRLSGTAIAALRRDDDNALFTDGIAGVRKIQLNLPDGDYRIVLMTQNFGVPDLVRNPFGQEIRINGIPLIVMRHGPPKWLPYAFLVRGRIRLAGGGMKRVRGYLAGDVNGELDTLLPRQQGGAVVVEGTAVRGKLSIELAGFENSQSYLTGLIVEPAKEPSDLVLSDVARDRIVPLALRIALETEILLVAAEAVQGIAPAAGQAFESEDVVTPN